MLSNSVIEDFCCDEHYNAYITARAKAREKNQELWTTEELGCLNVIETHLAEICAKSNIKLVRIEAGGPGLNLGAPCLAETWDIFAQSASRPKATSSLP
jgi:hypothetical protein